MMIVMTETATPEEIEAVVAKIERAGALARKALAGKALAGRGPTDA